MKTVLRIGMAAALAATLGACVPKDAGYQDVRNVVSKRTGHDVRWNHIESQSESAKAARQLLARPLTADSAVKIALLVNPDVQADLEELGIARAALVRARAIPNPTAEIGVGFPIGESGEPDIDLAATMDLTELIFMPLRKAAATEELNAARMSVAGSVMDRMLETKTLFYRYQASEQIIELRRTVLLASRSSFDAARRMHEAGNMNNLDFANEQALYEEARLGVASAEANLTTTREQLNAAMGVWGSGATWKVAGRLPDPPDADLDIKNLEGRALGASLDLAMTKKLFEAAARRANFEKARGWLPELGAGVEAEREEGEWDFGPLIEVEIPLFYQGQGEVAAARAVMRQQKKRFESLAVQIRSASRAAATGLMAARDRAVFYRDTLLPLRAKILHETQLGYNAMGLGIFQLLQAKRDQVETGRAYVEALRDYWIARAEVEQLLAGRVVRGSSMTGDSGMGAPTPGRASGDH